MHREGGSADMDKPEINNDPEEIAAFELLMLIKELPQNDPDVINALAHADKCLQSLLTYFARQDCFLKNLEPEKLISTKPIP